MGRALISKTPTAHARRMASWHDSGRIGEML